MWIDKTSILAAPAPSATEKEPLHESSGESRLILEYRELHPIEQGERGKVKVMAIFGRGLRSLITEAGRDQETRDLLDAIERLARILEGGSNR